MLTIAIDFDETLTADPQLWVAFIKSAKKRGHNIICVTCRRATDENVEMVREWVEKNLKIELVTWFTNLGSKLDLMRRYSVKVDIWIDDDPSCIIHGK